MALSYFAVIFHKMGNGEMGKWEFRAYLGTNLVATLTGLKVYNLAHICRRLERKAGWCSRWYPMCKVRNVGLVSAFIPGRDNCLNILRN
jgi:hypothetical protein